MRELAFFSVKGGTGRSLALANLAVIMARSGRRIGCVDLDVMAPGLLSIFDLPEDSYRSRASVIDLLLDLNNIELLTNSFFDFGTNVGEEKNRLWLIAAKPEPREKYQELKNSDAWSPSSMAFFRNNFLRPFSEMKQLDYLFIDARSGLAQESLCGLSLVERHLILFTRLDPQSINVTMHFLRLLKDYGYNRLIPVIVASNVPRGNENFPLGGQAFRLSKEAVNVLQKINSALDEFSTEIRCIIPFDESLLLRHRLISREEDNPTAKGYFLLNKIIEGL